MPRYVLPKPKKSSKQAEMIDVGGDEWRRRVSVPVNKAIIETTKTGEKVKVTLEATVIGTSYSESRDQTSGLVELDISAIEFYPGDESPGDYIKRRRHE